MKAPSSPSTVAVISDPALSGLWKLFFLARPRLDPSHQWDFSVFCDSCCLSQSFQGSSLNFIPLELTPRSSAHEQSPPLLYNYGSCCYDHSLICVAIRVLSRLQYFQLVFYCPPDVSCPFLESHQGITLTLFHVSAVPTWPTTRRDT